MSANSNWWRVTAGTNVLPSAFPANSGQAWQVVWQENTTVTAQGLPIVASPYVPKDTVFALGDGSAVMSEETLQALLKMVESCDAFEGDSDQCNACKAPRERHPDQMRASLLRMRDRLQKD